MVWTKEDYVISTDRKKLDIVFIHSFLTKSYWAEGITHAIIEKSIKNSLCFGVFHLDKQVGFAQVVTDKVIFGYLMNVFIIAPYRGRGLSKWLMHCILDHPDISGLRAMMLATRDAHGLYARYGFKPLPDPSVFMRRESARRKGSSY
ncbi:MAG: GNAT family N-acetyltransferase [Calditrichaceae bacterium]|nr:GNAT family N-acetyltransferase [Calditrichaceae bacterium]MBN2707417.1 GNAT family N-acetyltransferase [Calditrichaceae bacterium]RQV96950.1 MAG: N-acetyltransferase [Calditrichota bacterium]